MHKVLIDYLQEARAEVQTTPEEDQRVEDIGGHACIHNKRRRHKSQADLNHRAQAPISRQAGLIKRSPPTIILTFF